MECQVAILINELLYLNLQYFGRKYSEYSWLSLDSQLTALSEPNDIDDNDSDPANENNPSCNNSQNERNRGVDAIVTSSFKGQIILNVIHEIEDCAAW